MTLSMTGFGKSEVTLDHFNVNIEIRSLNSKFLDLSLKLPNIFKDLELPIRKLIKEKVIRGKVELIIHYEKINMTNTASLNKEKIIGYHNELKEITEKLNYNSDKDLIGYALKLPEIIQHSKDILNENSKSLVLSCVEKACEDLKKFRINEGSALEKELNKYLNSILEDLLDVNNFEIERLPKVKEKLFKAIDELNLKNQIDEKRLEQELIYYSEKIDLTEEKVRLKEHCLHFKKSIKETNSGKKLGFITQEMGREINTLGSKANHISIQKIVVNMKDELEKIKEQVLNVL
ncbi:MAG: YicC family protein [Bacteroidetes bacterium MED-G20]|nr:MAG: YicC family protein [Bacteroidetes bacterium MED-G20]